MFLFSLTTEKEELAERLLSLLGKREGTDSCSISTRWDVNQEKKAHISSLPRPPTGKW